MPALLTSRRSLVAALVFLTLLAAGRVVSTYRVFSQTVDEPIHIAAGYQWWNAGRYDLDIEHPPLARIAFGLDAHLHAREIDTTADRVSQGNQLLDRNSHYKTNLGWARAGNLPIFLTGLAVVFLWARRRGGTVAGVIAVALYGALPPILAHAGLATTDTSAAALTALALYTFVLWLERPDWKRALLFGSCVGLGMIGKFSFLVYFPAGAVVLFFGRRAPLRIGRQTAQLASGAVVAVLIVMAAYRFEARLLNDTRIEFFPPEAPENIAARYAQVEGYEWVRADLISRYYDYAGDAAKRGHTNLDFVDWAKAAGYPSPLAGRSGRNTIANAPPLPPADPVDVVLEPFRAGWQWFATNVPVPGMTYVSGAQYVARHSELGHPAYLFGETRQDGWWYYFPVVVFFKTPLAFLILSSGGILLLARRREPLAFVPLAMLAAAMTSSINIGVRHVLPMYPFMTIAAAVFVVWLWRRAHNSGRVAAVALLAWYFIATAIAHPDYLAYFNEAAGRHPERIAGDSNLDWGQDLFRLRDFVRRENPTPLYVSYFGSADWFRHVQAGRQLPHGRCVPGWIAISQMHVLLNERNEFGWLKEHEPVGRVGKAFRLYYVERCR